MVFALDPSNIAIMKWHYCILFVLSNFTYSFILLPEVNKISDGMGVIFAKCLAYTVFEICGCNTPGRFFTKFYKGGNFSDFLFAFLHTLSLQKGGRTVVSEVPLLKVRPFPLKM